jgi:hypothetical protein
MKLLCSCTVTAVTITNLVRSYALEKNINIYKVEYFSVRACYRQRPLMNFLSYERSVWKLELGLETIKIAASQQR